MNTKGSVIIVAIRTMSPVTGEVLKTFDELGHMLRRYRTSKVGGVLLDRDDSGVDVIQLLSHKPGPRIAR